MSLKDSDILKKTEIVISDVDGVWTDGSMYYGTNGVELKKFSVYDGGAVTFLKLAKIPLIILTGENNTILEDRFKKLKIEDVRLGITDKQLELKKVVKDYKIKLSNVLFIGDFINDYSTMKSIGIPVCPLNACEKIKEISKLVINIRGGEGVLWELTKKILESKNIYDKIFQKYLENIRE